MYPRRSNIKRTIAPAIVLMAFVFVLSRHLPTHDSEKERFSHSAKSHLEKELAIQKPRTKITVSTDFGRSTQTLGGKTPLKSEFEGRPLHIALQAYLAAHRPLKSHEQQVPAHGRYLIYEPGVVGWGNRLQGTLLVDWTSPVPLQKLVNLRNDIPLILSSDVLSTLRRRSVRNVNAWEHPNKYANYPIDVLKGQDLTKWSEEVVHFSAGEDWLSYLVQNTHIRDELVRVFGTHPEHNWSERNLQLAAHELLDFFRLELSDAAISLFERSSLAPVYDQGATIAAIQIRIGTNNTSFEPFVDLEKDVPKFWTCAESFIAKQEENKNAKSGPARIFLATDSHIVKSRALARFGERLLFFDGPIVHSGNEQLTDETGRDRDLEGLLKVVIDWWLLGESQFLFRSQQSTFGRSAAIRRPTPSIILPTQFEEGCAVFH